MAFTKKELEILYRANVDAYRNTVKRLEWVKSQDLGEVKECALTEAYEREMGEYLDMKLKLDSEIEAIK